MQLVLADDQYRDHLLPFTFTRPVADIRCGILTIRRKWELLLSISESASSSITVNYLSPSFPLMNVSDCLVINGALLPDESILPLVFKLQSGQQIVWKDRLLAARIHIDLLNGLEYIRPFNQLESVHYPATPALIQYPWNIFSWNEEALRSDFKLLTKDRVSQKISPTNRVANEAEVFIEPGAKIECAMVNANNGPVYIAKDAEVMEGAMIRGPFSLGEGAVLKMGAKIYGATTIGPGAKVGGEVSNSVIFGNSNKAHDGFLGNSVIGEWCNLGADSNNSNLKNNYSEVKVWNYPAKDYIGTGLQFCGLFMGDHSKCSINTMFNTGTVVGVSANIFGSGFPEKFIPSFSWGSDREREVFLIDKALELAEKVMSRRNIPLTSEAKNILSHLYLMELKPKTED